MVSDDTKDGILNKEEKIIIIRAVPALSSEKRRISIEENFCKNRKKMLKLAASL
jgi:hypothetical protein